MLHHPVVSFFTNPLVAAAMVYATMIGYFLTPFYNFSLEHPRHPRPDPPALPHLGRDLLVGGHRQGPVALAHVVPGQAGPARDRHPGHRGASGLALTGANTSIAPHFHTVADTRAGGSILWIVGELTMLTAMGLLLFQWMRFDEREQARADRHADQEAAAAAMEVAD